MDFWNSPRCSTVVLRSWIMQFLDDTDGPISLERSEYAVDLLLELWRSSSTGIAPSSSPLFSSTFVRTAGHVGWTRRNAYGDGIFANRVIGVCRGGARIPKTASLGHLSKTYRGFPEKAGVLPEVLENIPSNPLCDGVARVAVSMVFGSWHH